MSTLAFNVTFSVQDILRDPRIRVALREREESYQDNINWLDEDLNKKIEGAAATTIQKYTRRMITSRSVAFDRWAGLLPQPKIWHCGHAAGVKFTDTASDKADRRVRAERQYRDGLTNNTCIIGHRHQQENENGFNTRKQFTKFKEEAKEGDIIFTHSHSKLTHYGCFTGEIYDRDGGPDWVHSFISVYEWIPLPKELEGTGKNCTLYEVKPTANNGAETKNYQNYQIPS